MSAGVVRPDWSIQCAFNRDANDATTPPVWSDLTARLRSASGLVRGRQYELDIPMAADPTLTFRDVEEHLNPANPSSPYYGRIVPYREILWQGVYPNAGAGNLINANTWRSNRTSSIDPSFEIYTGAIPSWLASLGGMSLAFTSVSPFQGTQCVYWTNSASNTQQGASWPIACIPGRQYTSSAYVRQDAASTQVIAVEQTIVADQFQYRSSSSTWTNAEGPGTPGPAWTHNGGVNGDYTVANGSGLISISAVNSVRLCVIGANVLDGTVDVTIPAPSSMPTGAPITKGLVARYVDASNYYRALVQFNTDATITLLIVRRAGAVNTTLTTLNTSLTYQPGDEFRAELDFDGPILSARIWSTSRAPSNIWSTGDVTDAAPIIAAGAVGTIAFLNSGNTNTLPHVVSFDDFSAVGWVIGSSLTATLNYQRLTVTYVATQPSQSIKVVTQGAALAGVVRLDAIQHEHGASATAFTTTGAVIYPVMRNYAERWPRRYRSKGYEGYATVPCVDALAALNRIKIGSEYEQAVLSLAPDYYYRLNDGVDTDNWADTSGKGRNPLRANVSKYGPGTAPAPGTTIDVIGDPGGAGVQFTPTTPGSYVQAATILGNGQISSGSPPGISFPARYGGIWGTTIAAWVVANSTTPITNPLVILPFTVVTSSTGSGATYWLPSAMRLSTGGQLQALTQSPFGSAFCTGGANLYDNRPHHLVVTTSQDSTNTTVRAYVDGTQVATNTVTTASLGGIYSVPANTLNVGGFFNRTDFGDILNGTVGHVAMWDRALSATEISDLYSAGGVAFAGELSGTRTARHLALGQYTGATRISTGSTKMQPPSWTGRIDLGTDSLNTTVAEQGSVWPAPDGAVVFEGRGDRWLRLTPRWIFGEDVGAGEIPYLGDIEFDLDPTFVFPDVQVSRANGAVAIGGTAKDVAAALRRYFPLSYTATVDVQTDQQAQDLADWVFNSHRAALQRVSVLVLDPASNPALWPVVLGAEVGHRATMKRRAKAANGGAGITMSDDYFIEQIGHGGINFDTGAWLTGVMLSPIGASSAPAGPTFQPWILEDPAYGVLDSTTVLGW